MASYAMKRISPNKETFRKIPIFISNGESDRIADTTKTKALLKALRRSGFSNVRLETYPGRHSLNQDHVPVALEWFLEVPRP